ncbi:MAG: alpha/beta fold hydrolase [Leptospiraceae bacterium]|nr:alpha/beta fold hydrolase [Leptospiraceae bacterium]
MTWKEEMVQSGSLRLYLVRNDIKKRPWILFLHGFPDDHTTWSAQMNTLSARFNVATLDMRGVGRSDRPGRGKEYAVKEILPDIQRVIEHIGAEKVHLVGHDWGSMIGWCFATDPHYSRYLHSYTGIAAPHPGTILKFIGMKTLGLRWITLLEQLIRSWYIWFFQLPWLPELLVSKASPSFWNRLLRRAQVQDDDPMLRRSQKDFESIARGPIHLYRQLIRRRPPRPALPQIPCQQIIPDSDLFIATAVYDGQQKLFEGGPYRAVRIAGPHWVHRSDPDTVNEIILSMIPDTDKKKHKSKSAASVV